MRSSACTIALLCACASPSTHNRSSHGPPQSAPGHPTDPGEANDAQPAAEGPVQSAVPAERDAAGDEQARDDAADGVRDEPEPADDRPKLTSVRYKTWIWERSSEAGDYIGYVRVGQRVVLKSTDKVEGEGCRNGFYPIEPRGYVCDDATVTRRSTTPFLVANAHTLPSDGPYPYRYALSDGAPMYARLPTKEEQRRNEAKYGPAGELEPLRYQKGHEHLAVSDPIEATDEVPAFLAAGRGARGPVLSAVRRTLPRGAMFAFTKAFDHGGRTFLLSADLTVVPADRVRRFRRSRFHGVKLDGETELPIAWFRARERPAFRFEDGEPVERDRGFPVRSWAALTGEEREHDGVTYLRVEGDHRWARADDATVVEPYGKHPFGVEEGDRWIMVRITQGTLVAYEDLEPVFTTLVSPGKGGVPRKGGDPVANSTTPMGTFKITFKDRAATMAPEFGKGRKFWIADVPHTQYFQPPFALHGAYWHEKFGEPMSAGCVNLSPIDAAHLFRWTRPAVPPGWQGILGNAAKDDGVEATWVVVRR